MIGELSIELELRIDEVLESLRPGEEYTTASLFPDVTGTGELFGIDTRLRARAAECGLSIETIPSCQGRVSGLPFHIPWTVRVAQDSPQQEREV